METIVQPSNDSRPNSHWRGQEGYLYQLGNVEDGALAQAGDLLGESGVEVRGHILVQGDQQGLVPRRELLVDRPIDPGDRVRHQATCARIVLSALDLSLR